jgi:adenylate cyclase
VSDAIPEHASDASADTDVRKDLIRLTRRAERLELTLRQVEEIRDTNERLLERLRSELASEQARSEALLLNILPRRIVDRLSAGEQRIADRHEDVAVLYSDFVRFTELAGAIPVGDLVEELGLLFEAFDQACERHGVEKIKTIGDAYLAVAGLASEDAADAAVVHATATADLAIDMLEAVAKAGRTWQVRIGIDVGPVVSGVIGTRRFAYDVWGDAVNVASRLEATAEEGRIHVSKEVANLLGSTFRVESRGRVALKGKGDVETFFLVARR